MITLFGLRQATNFNPAESAETTFSRREDEFRFDGISEVFPASKHQPEGTYALEENRTTQTPKIDTENILHKDDTSWRVELSNAFRIPLKRAVRRT